MLVDSESGEFGLHQRGVTSKQSDEFHVFSIAEILANSMEDKLDLLNRIFDEIEAYSDEYNIGVVGVDAVYSFINENVKSQVQLFLGRVARLKARGKLVILVHHTRKDVSDKNNLFASMAGHSDLQRNFNAGLMLCDTGGHIIDDNERKCPVMELHYQCRDFPAPEPLTVYLGSDRQHHICDAPIVDDLFPDIPHDDIPLAHFIFENLPEIKSEAWATKELLDAMDACETLSWSRETLKKKLPQWVKLSYLRSVGHSPKRYYIGDELLKK
jgi:hypothetical protein